MLHDPAFWVAVSFIIFVILAFKPITKLLLSALDNRAKKIQSELDEALRLKEEAQELLASYQKKQKEAIEEAKNIVKYAEDESKRIAENAEKELEVSLNRRVELAMQRITSYEEMVLQEIRNNAVDVAMASIRSVIMGKMDKKIAEEMVTNAIGDIRGKLN